MRLIYLALLGILFFISCNKPMREASEDENKAKNAKYNFVPHSSKFMKTKEHGETYLEYKGKYACQVCHGEDLKGGNVKKSCFKCHKTYPHSKEFIEKRRDFHLSSGSQVHSKEFYKNLPECLKCHSVENVTSMSNDVRLVPIEKKWSIQGGKKLNKGNKNHKKTHAGIEDNGIENKLSWKLACLRCHDYPHNKSTWKEGEQHGKAFEDNWHLNKINENKNNDKDKLSCMDCHDEKSIYRKRHLNLKVISCKKCHGVEIPHGTEFTDVMHHKAHKENARRFFYQCQLCHLGKNKKQPYVLSKFRRFIRPEDHRRVDIDECAACHVEKKIPSNKIKNKRSWYAVSLREEATSENPYCVNCHKAGKVQPKLIDDLVLKNKYLLHSCGACHYPNKELEQLIDGKKQILPVDELEKINLKRIKIKTKSVMQKKPAS